MTKVENLAFCPDCDALIRLRETPRAFEIVRCPDCGERFKAEALLPVLVRREDESRFEDKG
jgi:NMD protein affecting ribosome stability and mRNA decay